MAGFFFHVKNGTAAVWAISNNAVVTSGLVQLANEQLAKIVPKPQR